MHVHTYHNSTQHRQSRQEMAQRGLWNNIACRCATESLQFRAAALKKKKSRCEPYPTVVRVTMDHQNVATIDWNGLLTEKGGNGCHISHHHHHHQSPLAWVPAGH